MSALQELEKHAVGLQEATGIIAQLIPEDSRIFVLLPKVQLPSGLLRVDQTDVLYITDQQYPFSAMDMFWTEVDVVRPDGSIPQGAEAIEQYLGRSWRRFSWHRNGIWNPAGNPLLDHYCFMEARWAKELNR
jgi:hypothetical protein